MSRHRISTSSLGESAQRQIAAIMAAPAIRDELAAETRRNATPEDDLQIIIANALRAVLTDETVWLHVPNGKRRSKAEAGKLKAMGVLAGIPDLLFAHAGRLYAIELKVGRSTASDAQKECHAALTRVGVPITIARSLDDALRALDAWGIPTRIARTP